MALNATVRQLNGAPQLEPAQTMVAINKVTMSFGEFTAVRDVDIQVGDGEFLAIVGPTGCGKSTILNSVAGLLKPSSGDVAIDGRTVSGVQESVGYLFQQDALLPWKTAYQNVELGLRFRGVPEAERSQITQRFYRAQGASGDGTGLGLAIADEIALLHQGTLAFGAGAQGKGLLVRLELPLQMPAVLSETVAAQPTGTRS